MKRKSNRKHPEFVRMTPAQLVEVRELLGLSQEEMGAQMETAISTYQDWEAGRSRIPGAAKVLAYKMLEFDRGVMDVIRERLDKRMDEDPTLRKP